MKKSTKCNTLIKSAMLAGAVLSASTLVGENVQASSVNTTSEASKATTSSSSINQKQVSLTKQTQISSAKQAVSSAQTAVNNDTKNVESTKASYDAAQSSVKQAQANVSSASSAVDHAKQLSQNAQSVIKADQQNVDSASSQVSSTKQAVASASSQAQAAQSKVSSASSQVDSAKQAVANAQSGVQQAEKQNQQDIQNTNAQISSIKAQQSSVQADKNQAEGQQFGAQGNVDDDKGNLQNAQNNLDQEKDTLNGLKDQQSQAQQKVNTDQQAVQNIQKSWGKGQLTLDTPAVNAWNEMHSGFNSNGYMNDNYESGMTAFKNVMANEKDSHMDMADYNGNPVYVGYVPSSDAQDNVKDLDPYNLDSATQMRLTKYAAGLINQIRAELNVPAVTVSSDADEITRQITDGYNEDNWDMDTQGHDKARVFAPLYDSSNKLSYMSEVASSWDNGGDASNLGKVSFNDLTKTIFAGLTSMLYNDSAEDEGHAIQLTDADNQTNNAVIGLSFDKYGWMHIEFFQGQADSPLYNNKQDVAVFPVSGPTNCDGQNFVDALNQEQIDHNNLNSINGQIAAQQETVNDVQKIVDQQQKIYDQDNAALQAINKRISDDTAKLNDLNNQLTDAQNKLANLQAGSQVVAAKQALA